MPGRIWNTKRLKSSLISGSATAVAGLTLAGRARKS
jgi:hypothetical protein